MVLSIEFTLNPITSNIARLICLTIARLVNMCSPQASEQPGATSLGEHLKGYPKREHMEHHNQFDHIRSTKSNINS